jgi:hypothetical protein
MIVAVIWRGLKTPPYTFKHNTCRAWSLDPAAKTPPYLRFIHAEKHSSHFIRPS